MGVRGFRHSESTKRRLSNLQRGERNSFYGRTHTPEWKAAQKRRWLERAKGKR